jgi:hypothetical protein
MADVDEQWLEDQWFVDQLLNHLNYVRFLLLSSSASSTLFIQSHPGPPFVDDYTTAMHLFIKAKEHVLQKAPRCDWQGDSQDYRWTNGWNERKHIDFLTQSKQGDI